MVFGLFVFMICILGFRDMTIWVKINDEFLLIKSLKRECFFFLIIILKVPNKIHFIFHMGINIMKILRWLRAVHPLTCKILIFANDPNVFLWISVEQVYKIFQLNNWNDARISRRTDITMIYDYLSTARNNFSS